LLSNPYCHNKKEVNLLIYALREFITISVAVSENPTITKLMSIKIKKKSIFKNHSSIFSMQRTMYALGNKKNSYKIKFQTEVMHY
jgi:hypothetical protein